MTINKEKTVSGKALLDKIALALCMGLTSEELDMLDGDMPSDTEWEYVMRMTWEIEKNDGKLPDNS